MTAATTTAVFGRPVRRATGLRVGMGFVAAPAASIVSGSMTGALGASWAAVAIPIIGPAIVGVTLGISAMIARRGRQKVAATQVVDSIEPWAAENRDAYMSGPRTRSAQLQALQNFDAMWNDVLAACGDPSLGDAGRRCISERQPGGQWDWFSYYRDPIANDPEVHDDPLISGIDSIIDPISSAVNASPYRWALPLAGGALILAALVGSRS
jgi:hypothetical protein